VCEARRCCTRVDPPYPLVNGIEILTMILSPLESLPELVADPAAPDELRRHAIEWLVRRGVNVTVVRNE